MKLIANGINGAYLRDILPQPKVLQKENIEIEGVLAAIAYGSDNEEHFLTNCVNNNYRLDIWMRYDHTIPVRIPLLTKLLSLTKKNIFCYQVPDILHSKVIWWKGYGAYIGSANLTDRAWISNIEAGVFISDIELMDSGLSIELEGFFVSLKELKESFPLSQEIIDELKQFKELRKEISSIENKCKKERTVQIFNGLHFYSKSDRKEKIKDAFRIEWNETLTILRTISDTVVDYRPPWVDVEIPAAWQADQLLHAYYYNEVRDGRKHPYEDFYQANKHNPNSALQDALVWWSGLSEPPTQEDHTFYESAPYIRNKLHKNKIRQLTRKEFEKICEYTHATKDHVIKIPLSKMGIDDKTTAPREERLEMYAKWLWTKKNKKGMNVVELLEYVLYDGGDNVIWQRLFKATKDPDYYIPHYGLNSIAEVIGWTIPEIIPPRNGRTSKALRALGYDVRVYS